MANEKPLFIPLKGEYYDLFESGDKTIEYRLLGPRWNHKHCYPGRHVVLSRGYGKQRRMTAIIQKIIISRILATRHDFISCYGDDPNNVCIALKLTNIKRA